MNYEEFILTGCMIFAFLTMVMLVVESIKEGNIQKYKDNHPINIFDYLVKPMPYGTFTDRQPFVRAWAWGGAIITLVGFGWVMTNVPSWFTLGAVYFGMGTIIMSAGLFDEIAPKNNILGMLGLGYGKWEEQIMYGMLIAVPFVLLDMIGMIYRVHFQIEGMPVASFILTSLMVPVVEEGSFL